MAPRQTRVLPITSINPPLVDCEVNLRDWWNANRESLPLDQVQHLEEAAQVLQTSCVPVAFPTETVYGLGADATRSEAVRGIYAAKQRPADNPLIVHVGSLDQLRSLLRPTRKQSSASVAAKTGHSDGISNKDDQNDNDPIPSHYHLIIQRFWPGPLTLLFPLPSPSPLAPEVSSSLQTVGIRMPSSPLARLLISLCERPLAAPSANASTRPSPTTAAHVLHDLDGRVDLILDGGACQVGVESTVIDGLGRPPVILRPGGVGIEEIRGLGGEWGDIAVAYHDRENLTKTRTATMTTTNVAPANGNSTTDGSQGPYPGGTQLLMANSDSGTVPSGPRAPGMKYRHYAPRAQVHLFENTSRTTTSSLEDEARSKAIAYYKNNNYSYSNQSHPHTSLADHQNHHQQQQQENPTTDLLNIGIICTKTWRPGLGFMPSPPQHHQLSSSSSNNNSSNSNSTTTKPSPSDLAISTFQIPPEAEAEAEAKAEAKATPHPHQKTKTKSSQVYSISLGPDAQGIARGLFSALRALDAARCGVILVEGVGDQEGEEDEGEGKGFLAAAVMNRLRKAAAATTATETSGGRDRGGSG